MTQPRPGPGTLGGYATVLLLVVAAAAMIAAGPRIRTVPFIAADPAITGDAAAASLARPNPARFYTKIGGREGKAFQWESAGDVRRNKIVRWSDLVFIDESLAEARAIAADVRARKPGIPVFRYWNMWVAFGNVANEATYTESMFVYENWPRTSRATRGRSIVNTALGACRFHLLDWSRPELLTEVGRVLANSGPYFDGVFFDNSSWDQFQNGYENSITGATDGVSCEISPFAAANPFVTNFIPASKDYAVDYMRYMQRIIDPNRDNRKLHFCNAIPRQARKRDGYHQSKYLAIVDGCQMDNAFVDGKLFIYYTGADWEFEMETLQKYVSLGKYFLVKVPWSFMDEPWKTGFLEYGFASYLLGTDGRLAKFMPAYGFTAWDTHPIVSAPLGGFLGSYEPVPGSTRTMHLYRRRFQNGLVYVNAGTQARTIALPAGVYRDARRRTVVSGSLTIPRASGRILVRL